ncbi:efflux RND transporter periplasmic adaptor subunit [bacterium]|nr:MAG: efflux RND transporter periplasmic adaptor subunit [bacterium]
MIFKLFKQLFRQMIRHKLITGIVVLLIIGGGYFGYQNLSSRNKDEVQYVTTDVKKGTLVVSVSGSGQVSASDEINILPKVSGDVVYVGAKNNQEVQKGALIAQLNTRDAQKAVLDAEIDLANAKKDNDIRKTAEESLAGTYQDGLDLLTSIFKDLSSTMPVLKSMFLESSQNSDINDIDYYLRLVRFYLSAYGSDLNQLSFWNGNLDDEAEQKYIIVQKQYNTIREKYSALNYSSSYDQIENVLDGTYDMTKILLDLVRQSSNVAQKYPDIIEEENVIPTISTSISDSHASQLSEFTSSLISIVNSVLSMKQSIANEKETMENIDLDIEEQNLTIRQYEYALSDAKEKLTQHYIYAPFDGIITEVNIENGDSVSSGTTLATLTAKQKMAEITLNEVDIANVEVGQKATITFDALDDLSITGEVSVVDVAGTVSQGVVTYDIKISFDSEDEKKVKQSMSISAAIITNLKQEVLLVPNAAIKYQDNTNYVEILSDDNTITYQQVEIGISNDMYTEIISGLKEGDKVISSQTTSSSNSSSGLSNNGSNRYGSGMNIMMMGR